jgi:hypothetical protein
VQLNEQRHEARGKGTIRLQNNSARALTELQFHLYLNAFENSRSLFFQSPFARARGGSTPATWGGLEVLSLYRSGQDTNLWESAQMQSPGHPEDQTSVCVPLTTPVAPGDELELSVEWVSRFPDLVERTGFRRDFYFAGQWYPKLAKLEPDGSWANFAFHPHGEFYANYGDYDVTVDVASNNVFGATGTLRNHSTDQLRTQHQYTATRVHDFAWTAWPGFSEVTREIQGVGVRLLIPHGHDHNAELTLDAISHGLEFFGSRFGPYPYPNLTVVHPPQFAKQAGGMEYPSLITTGGSWYTGYFSKAVEQVTLHELAHQWFYGILGSNEAEWPFLDEGLSSYGDSLALEARYGNASGARLFGFEISSMAYYRVLGLMHGHDLAIATSAARFPSFGHLGAIVYGRSASLLNTWERVHGAVFREAVSSYARRFRFGAPEPADLLESVRRAAGAGPAEQLETALFAKGWVDFAAVTVGAATPPIVAGEFNGSPPPPADPGLYLGRAVVVRRGTLTLPVDVALHTADGHTERLHWNGEGDWKAFETEGKSPLVSVVVDPEYRVLLDEDLTNNALSTQPRDGVRALGTLTYWIQLLCHWLGS